MTDTTIDLDKFAGLVAAQEAGNEVQIKAPDGAALGLTIVMAGPDSQRQRDARRAVLDERTGDGKLADMSMEDFNREVAARSVINWSHDIIVGGERLVCTPENARTVFSTHPFILDQCLPSVVSRSPFVKG